MLIISFTGGDSFLQHEAKKRRDAGEDLGNGKRGIEPRSS